MKGGLEAFLAEIETRAFRLAELRLGDRELAHDAVQDAMLRLAQKYAQKPAADWPPLFYRILGNRILDLQRARTRRRWLFMEDKHPDLPDPVDSTAGPDSDNPRQGAEDRDFWDRFGQTLRAMPQRQQETVVYRLLEGMDIAETARAMACSQGTVKTQYNRGMKRLKEAFGDTLED